MTFEDFIKITACVCVGFAIGVLVNPILGLVIGGILAWNAAA